MRNMLEEIAASSRLEDLVSAECVSLASSVAEVSTQAVNALRLQICLHQLAIYKKFSAKYRAGNCSPLENLLKAGGDSAFDAQRVAEALDEMEVDFDDWGDDLAHDAGVVLCNIDETLVLSEQHSDDVAALARGLELMAFDALNKAYYIRAQSGGSVVDLIHELIDQKLDFPEMNWIRAACADARQGARNTQ